MLLTHKQSASWKLYLAKTDAQRRIVQGAHTPFEQGNIQPWIARLHACNSLRAVATLRAEFEQADAC